MVAMLATALVAGSARAQQAPVPGGAPPPGIQLKTQEELRQDSLRLSRLLDEQPNVKLPIVVIGTGVGFAIVTFILGGLAAMGGCAGDTDCNEGVPPFVLFPAIGGGVALIGTVWLIERVSARREFNERYRAAKRDFERSTLRLSAGPTTGVSATLRF